MEALKRPSFRLSDEQNKVIAKEVFDNFKANFTSANITEYDIYKLMRSSDIDCGYELAKELEDNSGARIDTMIVDELDTIGYMVTTKQNELEKQWIKDNNIVPKFKINDKVLYGAKYGTTNETEIRLRNINRIDLEQGKYLIAVEDNNNNSSWVVDFETVENEVQNG